MATSSSKARRRLSYAAQYALACAALLVLVLAVAGMVWTMRAPFSAEVDERDLSGGTAACVNGIAIGENAITAYIQEFRATQGAKTDEGWARWLVRYGYTSPSFREAIVKSFVGMEALRQFAAENGVFASEAEIDERVALAHEEVGSDAAWEDFLVQSKVGDYGVRQNVESNLIDEALGLAIASAAAADDEAVLALVRTSDEGLAGAPSLAEVSSEVVAECREEADEDARSQRVAEAVAAWRAECDVDVSEAMPEGLPYDVDIEPYKDPEAGFAVPGIGFAVQHIAEGGEQTTDPALLARELEAATEGFKQARGRNADVYAWLCIPGVLGQPLLQHPSDDSFYLDHGLDGARSTIGCVYTERANAKDFSDPMTMIYGHAYTDAQVVLSHLHDLEKTEAFDATPEFFIVTEEKLLAYRIVSAYEFPDYHVLGMLDAMSSEQVRSYYDYLADPEPGSVAKLTRSGFELDPEADRIVQISTCTQPSRAGARFLVAGVLEGEEPRA